MISYACSPIAPVGISVKLLYISCTRHMYLSESFHGFRRTNIAAASLESFLPISGGQHMRRSTSNPGLPLEEFPRCERGSILICAFEQQVLPNSVVSSTASLLRMRSLGLLLQLVDKVT